MAPPAKPIDDMREQREETRAVRVIDDDGLSGIAPTRHVIDGTRKFKAQWTSHEAGR